MLDILNNRNEKENSYNRARYHAGLNKRSVVGTPEHSIYLKKQKELYQKNLEENRRKRRLNNRRRTQEIHRILGGKCNMCGNSDYRVLQVDHVFGDGNKERKERGHSSSSLKKAIINNPDRFQLLCANCNLIKKFTNKEFAWAKKD